jgi:hypothetical protein
VSRAILPRRASESCLNISLVAVPLRGSYQRCGCRPRPCRRPGARPCSELPGASPVSWAPLEVPPRVPSPLPNFDVVVHLSGETLGDAAPASIHDVIRLQSARAGRKSASNPAALFPSIISAVSEPSPVSSAPPCSPPSLCRGSAVVLSMSRKNPSWIDGSPSDGSTQTSWVHGCRPSGPSQTDPFSPPPVRVAAEPAGPAVCWPNRVISSHSDTPPFPFSEI